MQKKEPKKSPEDRTSNSRKFIQYTDVAFRMIAIILVGVFGGKKLDEWLSTEPFLTLFGSLFGTGAAIYIIIKGVSKK